MDMDIGGGKMTKDEAFIKVKEIWRQEREEIKKRSDELDEKGIYHGGLDNGTWHKDISEKYKKLEQDIISQIKD